jgi:hypothetical protein
LVKSGGTRNRRHPGPLQLPTDPRGLPLLCRSNTRLDMSPALLAGMMGAGWLPCRVLLKIVYLLTCRVLGLQSWCSGETGRRMPGCSCSGTRTRCCAGKSAGTVQAGRPGVVRRAGTAPAAQALDRDLPRDACEAPGLASQTGLQQVRHEQAAQARPVSADNSVIVADLLSCLDGDRRAGPGRRDLAGRPDRGRAHRGGLPDSDPVATRLHRAAGANAVRRLPARPLASGLARPAAARRPHRGHRQLATALRRLT